MMTLNKFIERNLCCSYDEAAEFISKFRHYDAVEYGRDIIRNHEEDFIEGFDLDSIEEETLANIAIEVENRAITDLSVAEDDVLKEHFPFEVEQKVYFDIQIERMKLL